MPWAEGGLLGLAGWAPSVVGPFFVLPFILFSFLTFDLGLQIEVNKFLKTCKIQNRVLGHYGTYFLSKVNIQYSYAFWPIWLLMQFSKIGFGFIYNAQTQFKQCHKCSR